MLMVCLFIEKIAFYTFYVEVSCWLDNIKIAISRYFQTRKQMILSASSVLKTDC